MGKIIIREQEFSFEQIKTGNWSAQDPYFAQALYFCKDWLTGKTEFELSTSGSTGTPKTIQVNRNQMEISAKATRDFFGIEKDAKLLCCLNTEMIAGKMMLVRGMEWEAYIYLIKPQSNPLEELNQIFDFAAMVPLQVDTCLQNPDTYLKMQQIINLIIGGAPSSRSLLEKIAEMRLNAYQTYGMTETVSHIALAKIEGAELVYKVLPGVQIGVDQSNRLWVKAPMAKENILQTNDVVELLNSQLFKWIGRADFTINSGGIKLQPEILEPKMADAIFPVFGKVDFFLIGKEDEKLGQKTVLVIEHPKDEKKASDLIIELKKGLERYQVPKEILFNPSFTKTESGKINRIASYKNSL
ncbi:AMP-binding protein [Shivajiella indica]|uniref:AMP-binding protein n=1 Tax=Shivajiella indica TaxID=872115 RepID=A0ABW5BAR4_9BACT